MKQVLVLSTLCAVALIGWRYGSFSKPPENPSKASESAITLWDIGFTPCLPPKEYPNALIISKSANGETLEELSPTPQKPFLIHFWAPWCTPCRSELPHFAKFMAEHPDIQMWCVADQQQTPQNVKAFFESQKLLGLPIMIDTHNRLTHRMNVDGLPTTVFFDAKGRERGRIVGTVDWTNKDVVALILRELLS